MTARRLFLVELSVQWGSEYQIPVFKWFWLSGIRYLDGIPNTEQNDGHLVSWPLENRTSNFSVFQGVRYSNMFGIPMFGILAPNACQPLNLGGFQCLVRCPFLSGLCLIAKETEQGVTVTLFLTPYIFKLESKIFLFENFSMSSCSCCCCKGGLLKELL